MIEDYLQGHYSPATAKAYQREIAIYTSNQQAAEKAQYKDVMQYIGVLRTRYRKAATLNRILSSIKVYYDYLCYTGLRDDHPASSIQLKDKRNRDIQLQDLFTSEELEQLLTRKERYQDLKERNKVLTGLLIYQALLPTEAEALTVGDIDLSSGQIHVRATAKTNSRTLGLKPNQVLTFYEYITLARAKLLGQRQEEALLLGLRGEAMTAADITKHIKRSFASLYRPRKVNAQTIRQSVIANRLKEGHDISVVQAFAGHKYPSSTQRYQQGEVETLQAAVNKYHPLQ